MVQSSIESGFQPPASNQARGEDRRRRRFLSFFFQRDGPKISPNVFFPQGGWAMKLCVTGILVALGVCAGTPSLHAQTVFDDLVPSIGDDVASVVSSAAQVRRSAGELSVAVDAARSSGRNIRTARGSPPPTSSSPGA